MRPSRPIPADGMRAVVQYLSVQMPAVVQSVADEGRRLSVLTEDGERIEFVLRRSTAAYHAVNEGPRLRLLP